MNIAVLVPVYNAERFLRPCLDSLLANRVEIFCLNDGSTDGSQEILEEYAEYHRNVHVSSQPNAGVAVTRNRLLDALPYDFDAFAFCDADDTVSPGMYGRLAEVMLRTGADIAETQWDGPETVLDDMSLFLLKGTSPNRNWTGVINKLYRRSAVGSIRFREELKCEEDYFFNFEVHQAILRKVLVPGNFYYYHSNPGSLTRVLNPRDIFESSACRIRLACEEFLKAERIPRSLRRAFREELALDAYRLCLRRSLRKTPTQRERIALFAKASSLFWELQQNYRIGPEGLGILQCLLYSCCLSKRYLFARVLSFVA